MEVVIPALTQLHMAFSMTIVNCRGHRSLQAGIWVSNFASFLFRDTQNQAKQKSFFFSQNFACFAKQKNSEILFCFVS
jgi:hypothetical protein